MEFTFHILLDFEMVKIHAPLQIYMINVNAKELQQNLFLLK